MVIGDFCIVVWRNKKLDDWMDKFYVEYRIKEREEAR